MASPPPAKVTPVPSPPAPPGVDDFDRACAKYLPEITAQIRLEAQRRAGRGKHISEPDAFRALDAYFRSIPPLRRSWADLVHENLFVIIAVLMMLVFGYLAFGSGGAGENRAFLDIAEIFAGAVVGSVAGSGIARRRGGAG
jgi:hypothetical protein